MYKHGNMFAVWHLSGKWVLERHFVKRSGISCGPPRNGDFNVWALVRVLFTFYLEYNTKSSGETWTIQEKQHRKFCYQNNIHDMRLLETV